jgi:hypothetical protein
MIGNRILGYGDNIDMFFFSIPSLPYGINYSLNKVQRGYLSRLPSTYLVALNVMKEGGRLPPLFLTKLCL